jgi:hypothetical protein
MVIDVIDGDREDFRFVVDMLTFQTLRCINRHGAYRSKFLTMPKSFDRR